MLLSARWRYRIKSKGTLIASQGISVVIGFDDGPFTSPLLERVRLIGAVCGRTRLDGVLSGFVKRDESDATTRMIRMIQTRPFVEYTRAVRATHENLLFTDGL